MGDRRKRQTHGMRNTKIYEVWRHMLNRCEKPYRKEYKNYGGRGVSVCEEWHNPRVFIEWAFNNGYREGLVIDRLYNDGNYEPSNCHFTTISKNNGIGKKRKQSNNKTGFVGVCLIDGKYRSQISINSKQTYIGTFNNVNDAVKSRIDKEIELFGEQKTNFHFNESEVANGQT